MLLAAIVVLAQVSIAEKAVFIDETFDNVTLDDDFKSDAHFSKAVFRNGVTFRDARFHGRASFLFVDFGERTTFEGVNFDDSLSFFGVTGDTLEIFGRGTVVRGDADFQDVNVRKVSVHGVTFGGRTTFFGKQPSFLSLRDSTFTYAPDLANGRFSGRLTFTGSTFKEGLDLRFVDLSKTTAIVLDRIRIDPRELRFSWNDLRGKLAVDPGNNRATPKDWFPRLEASYELVVSALKARGNEADAEEVLYELEVRRHQAFGGFWHGAYGLLLGYGYAPWRVIFVVIPLILLFALLFVRYRFVVADILDDDIKKGGEEGQLRVSGVARVAHLLFFSTAVLLGIRFKSDWIRPSNTPFVLLVTIEWALGIALYITFFALVKTSGFTYVKGLLGF